MTITWKPDNSNSCPNYCTYVLLWFLQNHTHTFRLWVCRGFCEHEKISGQTEKFQDREKLASYPWGKIYMQTTEYQSRSRAVWWLNISYKIYKEIRRTTESHWSFQEPSALEKKCDLFLLFFLFVKPLTVHYLVHPESHWI